LPLLSILALLFVGSEVACCPLHWTEHEGSCYWFSESEKSWPEADKYCRLENSHLVVVNSLEEQVMLGWALFSEALWSEGEVTMPFSFFRIFYRIA
jgi:hypothetical protein